MERLGFILRQGWAALDFAEEREIAQLRRLWESLELEIVRVLEAGNALKESPDYELHRLTTRPPAFFDETVRRHVEGLEKELAALESEAEKLAKEIEELTGECAIGDEYGPANRASVGAPFGFLGVGPPETKTTFSNRSNPLHFLGLAEIPQYAVI